uniref:Uncharacterized protein n=1 Tax=Arundo donax TaxID=35708 RepID=A0A0A9FC89_ARUDO
MFTILLYNATFCHAYSQ